MGKAARNKRKRRPVPGIPGLPSSPYADAFTQAEWDEVLERKDRLLRYFRDPVKVTDGTILGIDEATLQLLLIHAVLAGVTQDDDLALIRPRVLPDEDGRLVDSTEWVVKRWDTPEQQRADDEEEARRRKRALDVQLAQMSPGAQEAFRRMFLPAARDAFLLGAQQAERYMADADAETDEARELREQAERLRAEGKL